MKAVPLIGIARHRLTIDGCLLYTSDAADEL